MRIELELWHLIVLGTSIVGGFFAVARMLIAANQKAIDEQFMAVAKGLESQDATNRRLERDLMELKAELPRDYVRREDYTQAIATIMTKIDHVALRVEDAIRRAYQTAALKGDNHER
jgi:hypothetical protein